MPVDSQILSLLVCPETRQRLAHVDPEALQRINQRIHQGELTARSGEVVKEPLEEALIREDGKCLYRVDDGIPNLLVDEQIALTDPGD